MIIRNNIPGMNATRNKGIAQGNLQKKLEKLSSGYRINRAGDDAAGLALSEGMRNQIEGLSQSLRNCNDGIALTNTGDGALAEVHAMLQRLQTLAAQSANGTYNTVARLNLDLEREQLLSEIDRIASASDFNDIPLFDFTEIPDGAPIPVLSDSANGDVLGTLDLQIGPTATELLAVERYHVGSQQLHLKDTNFREQEAANKSIDMLNNAIEAVADIRAAFGAASNRLVHAYANLSVETENMTAAESQIRDADMAQEFTDFTKENIILQSANSMNAQANAVVNQVLSLLQ